MDPKEGVLRFFDARADSYEDLSSEGLWKLVRSREAKALLALAGVIRGAAVLELGSGSGFYSILLRDAGAQVLGVDFSPRMVAALERKKFSALCADIGSLRLQKRFDLVFGAGVLEFLPDASEFFSTAREHAAPGSRLVILVPRGGLVGRAYRAWHRARGCEVFLRSPRQLRADAALFGWKFLECRSAGPLAMAWSFSEGSRG
jgi:SAM-dependent methyltransferase